MISPQLLFRIIGILVLAVCFYHFWALWGVIMAVGVALLFIP